MFGPPREMNKKNRLEEMRVVQATANCEIGRGEYSSFKMTQGTSPGFAKPVGVRRRAKENKPTPAPGENEMYSSLKGVNERGKNKGWGTSRTSAWMEDPSTPGVGSYTPRPEVSVHPGFSKKQPAVVITTKLSSSRVPTVRKPSPGPGDYFTEVSSLRRGPSKVGWRSPSQGERDGWRHHEVTPGPCYNPDDYSPKPARSKAAVQTLGGASPPRTFVGHVNSSGFVPATYVTDVGPGGEFTPTSDFDVAHHTFNKYARQQSLKKSFVSSPRRSHSRSRSRSHSSSRLSIPDTL